MRLRVLGSVLAVAFACIPAGEAAGQCMHWDAGVGLPPFSMARCLCAHDDGAGRMLYAAHDWTMSKWTGSAWQQVGWDFDKEIRALCEYDDGSGAHLFACGDFNGGILGGPATRGLAKLVGSTWQEVGGGVPASTLILGLGPRTLAVFDAGTGAKLFVGGVFHSTGGLTNSILSWDGASWASVGSGLGLSLTAFPSVNALCVFDDGSGPALFAAGHFDGAGGLPVNNIAKWDGSSWSPLGSGITGSNYPMVTSLAVYDDGNGPALFAAGTFESAGGVTVDGIAKWDGTIWSALPWASGSPGMNEFSALSTYDDGRGSALYVGGYGPSLGFGLSTAEGVGRWDGSTWTSLGSGFDPQAAILYAILPFDDGQGGGEALWFGGAFGVVGGDISSLRIARWHGGCTNAVDVICVGDGSFAPCPCANYGASLSGCANSASATGAALSYSGATQPDTLVLTSTGERPTSLSLFVQNSALRAYPYALGDGIYCLSTGSRRLYLKTAVGGTVQAPEAGDLSISQRSAALGDPLTTGAVRYYQVWYRDGAPSFCTLGLSNVTNGLRVVW